MKIYIQKAMKSASEWNSCFIKERKEERRAYFDQQTFVSYMKYGMQLFYKYFFSKKYFFKLILFLAYLAKDHVIFCYHMVSFVFWCPAVKLYFLKASPLKLLGQFEPNWGMLSLGVKHTYRVNKATFFPPSKLKFEQQLHFNEKYDIVMFFAEAFCILPNKLIFDQKIIKQ